MFLAFVTHSWHRRQNNAREKVQPNQERYFAVCCDCPEWVSPAFPVPKPKKNKWRLVVDLRELNTATVADVFPLPLIDDLLERQGRGRVFSAFDLKHGFFQIPRAEEDRPQTACVTPNGLCQWRVMPIIGPMGLKNAQVAFSVR